MTDLSHYLFDTSDSAFAIYDEYPEACCFSDGTCLDLGPTDCATQSGISQGPARRVPATRCPGRVWTVYADGSGDAPTMQSAVDSSITGDSISVMQASTLVRAIGM